MGLNRTWTLYGESIKTKEEVLFCDELLSSITKEIKCTIIPPSNIRMTDIIFISHDIKETMLQLSNIRSIGLYQFRKDYYGRYVLRGLIQN